MTTSKIIWTKIDEAPALATYSLLPVVQAYTQGTGVDVVTKDISLAGRIIANFPDKLTDEQRIDDALAELGRLARTPEARQRLSELKEWRRKAAEGLDLDPGTIWPAAHLERLALTPDAELASLDEGTPPWVRRWQWQTLGESLEAARRSL